MWLLCTGKTERDPAAKLADKLFTDLKFRKNTINAALKDCAEELPVSNEVENVVHLFNMSTEK